MDQKKSIVDSIEKMVGTTSEMKKVYERKLSQMEDKIKKEFKGRLTQMDNKFQKVNENLVSLVTYSHTVVKNSAKSINTMVGKLESLHQEGTTMDVDALDKKEEETIVPCKISRANLKKKFANKEIRNHPDLYHYGDGLAIFLAPFGSVPPLNCEGKWLGLFNQSTDGNSSNQIVAVEFDTFEDEPFDPDNNHVGINVNSVVSKATVALYDKSVITIASGSALDAWVDYDGLARRLEVFLTSEVRKPETPILSYDVDLTKFLPQKIKVGISPSTAYSWDVHDVGFWEFLISHDSPAPMKTPTKRNYVSIVVFTCFITVAGFALLVGLCYFRNKSGEEEDIEMDNWISEGPRKFSHAELSAATQNFSQERKLGGGGFGDVYRGILPGAKESVAVTRIFQRSKQGKKEYLSEVTIIRSLDKYIFGGTCLDWDRRHVIACDIAAALVYLHEECKERVVHRDVKASNIMLDSEYRAKLGDFGLASLIACNPGNGASTVLAGTVGYIAPECVVSRNPSTEWDVFSFGAVCLEIGCGRRVVDSSLEEHGCRLVEWVWDLHSQGKLLSAADERLNGNFDGKEMERVLQLGLLCSHPDHKARPSMRKVVNILGFDAEVPRVPLTYPVTVCVAL
ncbi:probable L-type lectin-domain containing receptor kinase S.7 [Cryptomeria japonica]|uniref:probable L-type lectin-domain containing receptor kinase S.7 n=1 Tax=Cryptomeria japonica TaxID=3369 RepID=UPI0027DA9539|nr:probable L-type lectin-domain containing receptor kinase S.7 [Cryptomeria japonica]